MDEFRPSEMVCVKGERASMPVVRQVGDTVTCLRSQRDGSHEEVDYPRAVLIRAPKSQVPRVVTYQHKW